MIDGIIKQKSNKRLPKMACITALLPALILAGCGGGGGQSPASAEQSEKGGAGAVVDSSDAAAPQPGSGSGGTPSPVPASSAKATPAPSEKYAAKISKVDKSKDDAAKYNVEVTFTSAQGRAFTISVLADKTGAIIFSERVDSVPDYYYAHTTSFSYPGPLSDLNAQVKSNDSGQVLDTWDL